MQYTRFLHGIAASLARLLLAFALLAVLPAPSDRLITSSTAAEALSAGASGSSVLLRDIHRQRELGSRTAEQAKILPHDDGAARPHGPQVPVPETDAACELRAARQLHFRLWHTPPIRGPPAA